MAPIFILGAGRSGTSRLASSLKRVTRLPGDPEGHFYPLATAVEEAVLGYFARTPRSNPKTTMGRLDQDAVVKAYREVVKNTLEGLFGDTFLEKTPGPRAIAAMPIMLGIWPDTKLIYRERHVVLAQISYPAFPMALPELGGEHGQLDGFRGSSPAIDGGRAALHGPSSG
jgi:hypothetical protein